MTVEISTLIALGSAAVAGWLLAIYCAIRFAQRELEARELREHVRKLQRQLVRENLARMGL